MKQPQFTLTAEEVEIIRELSLYIKENLEERTLNEISMEEIDLYESSTNLLTRITQWQDEFDNSK